MSNFNERARVEASKYQHQITPSSRHKFTFDCGANKEGGGGFQPGNKCGGDGDGKDDKGDQGGGDKKADMVDKDAQHEEIDSLLDAADQYHPDMENLEVIIEDMVVGGDMEGAKEYLENYIAEQEDAMAQADPSSELDPTEQAELRDEDDEGGIDPLAWMSAQTAHITAIDNDMPDEQLLEIEELLEDGKYEEVTKLVDDYMEPIGEAKAESEEADRAARQEVEELIGKAGKILDPVDEELGLKEEAKVDEMLDKGQVSEAKEYLEELIGNAELQGLDHGEVLKDREQHDADLDALTNRLDMMWNDPSSKLAKGPKEAIEKALNEGNLDIAEGLMDAHVKATEGIDLEDLESTTTDDILEDAFAGGDFTEMNDHWDSLSDDVKNNFNTAMEPEVAPMLADMWEAGKYTDEELTDEGDKKEWNPTDLDMFLENGDWTLVNEAMDDIQARLAKTKSQSIAKSLMSEFYDSLMEAVAIAVEDA